MIEENDSQRQQKSKLALIAWLIAFAIWAVIAVVGFWAIPATLDMAVRIYAAFWGDYAFYGEGYWNAVALRQFLVLPLALLYIVAVIGSAEYYYRNLGEPGSWKFFSRIIAVEASIVVLSNLI